MGLLKKIQYSLLSSDVTLETSLLKLRFLADRLGSELLDDWVQHELLGYPDSVEVPEYRKTEINHTGTFSDGRRILNNVTIPSYLIRQHAGDAWIDYELREPIAVIDQTMRELNREGGKGERFGVNSGNLKLRLEGKVYPGFGIVDIGSEFSSTSFVRIQSTVRTRALELTLRLERELPIISDIELETPDNKISVDPTKVSKIAETLTNYGTINTIRNDGDGVEINLEIVAGDKTSLQQVLEDSGIPASDAAEFASIIAAEEPDRIDRDIGDRARSWIGEKISKGTSDAWGITTKVATAVLTKAALKFYGLG